MAIGVRVSVVVVVVLPSMLTTWCVEPMPSLPATSSHTRPRRTWPVRPICPPWKRFSVRKPSRTTKRVPGARPVARPAGVHRWSGSRRPPGPRAAAGSGNQPGRPVEYPVFGTGAVTGRAAEVLADVKVRSLNGERRDDGARPAGNAGERDDLRVGLAEGGVEEGARQQ